MLTWVKLYTEIIDDPDQGTLTLAQRGIWSMFLALAGRIDDRDDEGGQTGRLDTPERVAWLLRCSPAEIEDAVEAFTHRGMVDMRDGVIYVSNFGKRQSAMSDAERQWRRRERQRRELYYTLGRDHDTERDEVRQEDVTIRDEARQEDVTDRDEAHQEDVTEGVTNHDEARQEVVTSRDEARHEGVTIRDASCHEAVTNRDTDTERDTERERGGDPPPKPPPKPSEGLLSGKNLARRLYDTYYEHMGVPPNPLQLEQIVDAVTDEHLFASCLRAWRMAGYSPHNAQGVLDWYRRGGPPNRRVRDGPPRDFSAGVCPRCGASPCRCKQDGTGPPDDLERAKAAFLRARNLLRQHAIAAPFEHATVIGFSDDGERVRVALEEGQREWVRIRPQLIKKARECGVEVVLETSENVANER